VTVFSEIAFWESRRIDSHASRDIRSGEATGWATWRRAPEPITSKATDGNASEEKTGPGGALYVVQRTAKKSKNKNRRRCAMDREPGRIYCKEHPEHGYGLDERLLVGPGKGQRGS